MHMQTVYAKTHLRFDAVALNSSHAKKSLEDMVEWKKWEKEKKKK